MESTHKPLVFVRDQKRQYGHAHACLCRFLFLRRLTRTLCTQGHHSPIDGRLNQYKAILFEWDPERFHLWTELCVFSEFKYPTDLNASRLSHYMDSPILLLMQCGSQPSQLVESNLQGFSVSASSAECFYSYCKISYSKEGSIYVVPFCTQVLQGTFSQ